MKFPVSKHSDLFSVQSGFHKLINSIWSFALCYELHCLWVMSYLYRSANSFMMSQPMYLLLVEQFVRLYCMVYNWPYKTLFHLKL